MKRKNWMIWGAIINLALFFGGLARPYLHPDAEQLPIGTFTLNFVAGVACLICWKLGDDEYSYREPEGN